MKSYQTIKSAIAFLNQQVADAEIRGKRANTPSGRDDCYRLAESLDAAIEALYWVLGEPYPGTEMLLLGESCNEVRDTPADPSAN